MLIADPLDLISVVTLLVPGGNLRFTALKNLGESLDINSAWESIRGNIKA
jgi:hypothetical protein